MSDARGRQQRMSLREFLRFESVHSDRHEFVAGDVYALSGGTLRHSRIIQNISFALMSAARGGPCQVHSNIMMVQIDDDRAYYPDLLALCVSMPDDAKLVRDPCLIVEVTSPSTLRVDRGEKLDAYRRLTSLRAYLIVDQRRRRVDRHWPDHAGVWRWEEFLVEGSVPVPCIDTTLTLDEIYEGVDLPHVAEPDVVEYEI